MNGNLFLIFRTIPWPVLRTLLIRVAMLLVVAGCCGLVSWSVKNRLLPAGRQVREKTSEMTRLANEVQRLEMTWDKADVEQTESRFQQARSRLFVGSEALVNWQKETERRAEALALKPAAQRGEAKSHPAAKEELRVLPVALEIRPLETPRGGNNPYQRLLNFAQVLENPEKRLDLVELSISGSSNSLQQVKLLLNVWTPEKLQP